MQQQALWELTHTRTPKNTERLKAAEFAETKGVCALQLIPQG